VLDGRHREVDRHAAQHPCSLHPYLPGPRPVHHHVGDRRVGQERLQGPQAADRGQDLAHHAGALARPQEGRLLTDEGRDTLGQRGTVVTLGE
jgi:hypothetical protein